jgi:hypothetical protein
LGLIKFANDGGVHRQKEDYSSESLSSGGVSFGWIKFTVHVFQIKNTLGQNSITDTRITKQVFRLADQAQQVLAQIGAGRRT